MDPKPQGQSKSRESREQEMHYYRSARISASVTVDTKVSRASLMELEDRCMNLKMRVMSKVGKRDSPEHYHGGMKTKPVKSGNYAGTASPKSMFNERTFKTLKALPTRQCNGSQRSSCQSVPSITAKPPNSMVSTTRIIQENCNTV
jgi:hypothetical protein